MCSPPFIGFIGFIGSAALATAGSNAATAIAIPMPALIQFFLFKVLIVLPFTLFSCFVISACTVDGGS